MKTSYLPHEVRERWDQHPGAWNSEPDRVEWRDSTTGLVCLALRQPSSGHWCGYVGVGPEHPWHGKRGSEVEAKAHGGLTFASGCQSAEKLGEHRVCHTPEAGEPEHLWWVGFDCAHAGDFRPVMSCFERRRFETYKTLSFVQGQCASLARQAAEALP